MWDWGSPVAWSVFVVGAATGVLLLSVSLQFVSKAVANFMALPVNKKRR